ncbi:MAG: hypothetical protein ACOYNY_12065 [Caldilineaceae bacterium]
MRFVRAALLRVMFTLVLTLLILILAQAVQAAEPAPVVEYYHLQP